MQVYGVDLSVWLRARRHRSLLELIDELPDASRLKEAQLNDPEYAEMVAQLPETEEKWKPAVREYDVTAIQLSRIHAALLLVYQAVTVSYSNKVPKTEELPGPETEVDRARERLSDEKVQSLIERLMPRG